MVDHKSVLVGEVLEFLRPRPGGVYVDGTLGLGGHARAILEAAGGDARLIGLDWDDEAAAVAEERLAPFAGRVTIVRQNYANLASVLDNLGVRAVDGLLLDLGVSSLQLDSPSRGFSFSREGPLDMRMSRQTFRSAAALVSESGEGELERIFRQYGEEPRARGIARALGMLTRLPRNDPRRAALASSKGLGDYIARNFRQRGKIHPATRVFQALRIAVNGELDNLQRGLENADKYLAIGGRVVVISFHSLEDRIVKNHLREAKRAGRMKILTKKPVRADREETRDNPRARSAKLRAAERVEAEE